MRRILLCLLLAIMTSAPLLSAQTPDSDRAIASLIDLSRRGQFEPLIRAANLLLAEQKLAPADQGLVLLNLGYAYQQRGQYTSATAAYEKALAVINSDGRHSADYGVVLDALGNLYAELGQIDTAKHMLLRSVHLFENEGNHAGAALAWNHLASIAAELHSRREAHKDMAHIIAETQLVNNLTPAEFATIATTKGRVAELDGDPHTAISDYLRALELWKQTHKDQQHKTAWLYVLLGGAYLQAGDIPSAREAASRGLTMLGESSGRESARYLAAALSYAKVLDASGDHNQATTLRQQAQAALDTGTDRQRAQSQISVNALR
jgi:tetratricopeptide (TPR) repeat protein